MTDSSPDLPVPQIRSIRRRQVQQYLAVSAFVATQLITGCGATDQPDEPETQVAEPTTQALFYETTVQCEAHARQQQTEYAAKMKAYQNPPPPSPNNPASTAPSIQPTPPVMKAADCAAQMTAAQKEHDRHAPVYASLADCQADGVQCAATPTGSATRGYRPIFGGTYFYPYDYSTGSSTGSSYSSSSHVYAPRTVYRGFSPGSVVTPQGTVLTQNKSGVVAVPQHTTLAAPSRPQGVAARGTITGRNSQGFGSTFKSTGRGGK